MATCDAGFDGVSLGRDIFLTRSIKMSSLATFKVSFDRESLDKDILVGVVSVGMGVDAGVGLVAVLMEENEHTERVRQGILYLVQRLILNSVERRFCASIGVVIVPKVSHLIEENLNYNYPNDWA